MHNAIVFQIKEGMLSQHPNADRLQVLNFDGVEVVVAKDYEVGQICMYFPLDTQIEYWFLHEHNLFRHNEMNSNREVTGLFEDSGRVRGVKLRGVISLGFIYVPTAQELKEWKLSVGDSVNTLNGKKLCQKYFTDREVQIKNEQKQKTPKKKSANFSEHFRLLQDTPNLFEYIRNLKEGDNLLLTLKLHGTSGRTGSLPLISRWNWKELLNFNFKGFWKKSTFKVQTGSRKLNLFADNVSFAKEDFRKTIHDKFKDIPENYVFYYEIVGYTENGGAIQKVGNTVFHYGELRPNCNFYVYKVEVLKDDGTYITLSYNDMAILCKDYDFGIVPVLHECVYKGKEELLETLSTLEKLYSGDDPIGHHLCEGLVIRVKSLGTWKVCKYKFKQFCLQENIASTEDLFNMENVA